MYDSQLAQARKYALLLMVDEGKILLSRNDANANWAAVDEHSQPLFVALAFITLAKAGLLDGDDAQANRDAVVKHKNPWDVAEALALLKKAQLLTGDGAQDNWTAVVSGQAPCDLARALIMLAGANLLSGPAAQANRNAMAQHKNLDAVTRVFNSFKELGFLNGVNAQANFNAIVKKPLIVEDSFKQLKELDLLGRSSMQVEAALIQHANPRLVTHVLYMLKEAKLFENNIKAFHFKAVVALLPEELDNLCDALNFLRASQSYKDLHSAGTKLQSFNIQLNDSYYERLRTAARTELEGLLKENEQPIEINWRLVRLIGIAYEKGRYSHHEEHAEIAAKMSCVPDQQLPASDYLVGVYQSLGSSKTQIAKNILRVFTRAGPDMLMCLGSSAVGENSRSIAKNAFAFRGDVNSEGAIVVEMKTMAMAVCDSSL